LTMNTGRDQFSHGDRAVPPVSPAWRKTSDRHRLAGLNVPDYGHNYTASPP